MKHTLTFLIVLLALAGLAQNKANLVVFSDDGDPFYAYVNGVRQNDKPETNVKITDLSPNVSLRITFENKALPELKQTMMLEGGYEHTARIKRDKQQQLKLRYFGQTPLAESNSNNVPTVTYHTAENPGNQSASSGLNSQTSVSSTTTSTTIQQSGTPNDMNVNISIAGVGMNMNVNGVDQTGGQMQTTTSTTVTESSSSTFSGVTPETQTTQAPPAKGGCASPMDPASFSDMKKSVESKPFSDTKMGTAKVATKNSCLNTGQIKEICKLFSMDEDKLAYAKYAYDYCVDRHNYYKVGDVFSFSSTTEELNKFLEQ